MKKIVGASVNWVKNHKELSLYIFFGALTTLISFVSYFAFRQIFPDEKSVPSFLRWTFSLTSILGSNSNTALPVFLSWVLAVTFAYITNRIFVFNSTATGFFKIIAEALMFYGGRIFTLFVELLIMFLFVDLPRIDNGWYELIIKMAANVVVLTLNYIISKILIFRKKSKKNT